MAKSAGQFPKEIKLFILFVCSNKHSSNTSSILYIIPVYGLIHCNILVP